MVVGYDAQGNQIMATVPGPNGCFQISVQMKGLGVDAAGNVYDATETSSSAAWVMKYGADGITQWQAFGFFFRQRLKGRVG